MARRDYWLLSAYYAVYFGILGVWIPYWSLYLDALGHGAEAIGTLLAISLGCKVLGPPVWGTLADNGSRRQVIRLTSLASFLAFCLFFLDSGFATLAVAMATFSIFQSGPMVLVEVSTLEAVKRTGGDYGRVRLWGSIGFILSAFSLGRVIGDRGPGIILWVIALLLLLGVLVALALPESGEAPGNKREGKKAGGWMETGKCLASIPGLGWFYLCSLMMQMSHGAYYGFLSIHLAGEGFSPTAIGFLWALGVAAEVVVMFHARWLGLRLGYSTLWLGSVLFAALRWGIFAVTLWWPLLVLAQIFHAFTFGTFHIASVERLFEGVPAGIRATAQAWYAALSFGIGLGLGTWLSGYLFGPIGAN
ncbi:MAG: MFS transporter, partial [Magnetococcales bacterium]|nr:MFS transporter [Magnetococcales bacterium]